ncbi:MAG: cation diffusion facilitator family transporter [Eubacterium sp.]|nr:cation diffusion facilitator family transporter [Eubacterium sp.]
MISKLIDDFIKKRNWSKSLSRERLGIISGIFGIFCNILLCAGKFLVGALTNSVSITADAVNNLSDAGSSIVTIAGTKLANKPVDEEHPFGHGRIEYISALVVSFFIFIMSFELAKSSVEKIINPQNIQFSIWYVIVLTAAILVKLFMAYFNNILYKKTDNINLKAVMQDSLNDCLATGATIAALLISYFTEFKRADGIIGLVVAIIILIAGVNIVKDISGRLLGQPPSETLVKSIEDIITSHEEIIGVHDLIVHDYGPGRIIASAHAEVPSTADIVEIHDVIDNIEKEISKKLKIVICIHMDPIVVNDEEVDYYKSLTQKIISEMNEQYSFHDFKMVKGPTHTNLIFDLVVPYEKNRTSAQILHGLRNRFSEENEAINLVVTIEHSYV